MSDAGNDPTFAEPWQARAFAVAVSLTEEEGERPWTAFQEELVERIDDQPEPTPDQTASPDGDEDEYYRDWLAALEEMVTDDAVDAEDLRERALAFERGDRSAHEFVAGDPHSHTDGLPEGHAEGNDHGDHDHAH